LKFQLGIYWVSCKVLSTDSKVANKTAIISNKAVIFVNKNLDLAF